MPQSPTWTDAEKAQWILENHWNESKITYVYERVGETVYRIPAAHSNPPWIPRKRELYGFITEDDKFELINI